MASPAVECVLPVHANTGESPIWSARDAALYWIDIEEPALHRFDPASGQDRSWPLPAQIGAYVLAEDGRTALVALRTGLHDLDLATGALAFVAPPPFDPALFRFNEGKCDGSGRFWLGTMFDPLDPAARHPPQPGRLHSFTRPGGFVPHDDMAVIPNGMEWDAAETAMFIAHTTERTIYRFRFDRDAGQLSDRQVFATIPEDDGEPDGAAMDAEGCYWIALHNGGRIRRFRPDGSTDRDILLPVRNPTMCAFGGPELDVLYITTAAKGISPDRQHPHDGALFRCMPGIRGCPNRQPK